MLVSRFQQLDEKLSMLGGVVDGSVQNYASGEVGVIGR